MGYQLELPSYENIAVEELAAQIGLNAKHIPILLQSFIDESRPIMQALHRGISSGNYDDIAHHAHSIKGSSGNLKLNAMYELAKAMELAAKDKEEGFPYEEAYESLHKAISTISF